MTNSQQIKTTENEQDQVLGSKEDNGGAIVSLSPVSACLPRRKASRQAPDGVKMEPGQAKMEQAFNPEERVPFPRRQ